MQSKPKIYFQSISEENHRERDFYTRSILEQSDSAELVQTPREADWIIITGFSTLEEFKQIPQLTIVKDFPDKVLILSECDQTIELWPGLYTSGLKTVIDRNLVHGWYYPYFRVRFPNNTILQTGDLKPVEKKYLASFTGYPSHSFRFKLSRLWENSPEIFVSVTKNYHHFETKNKIPAEVAQQNYQDTIRSSHFSLCPRGRGPSSIRLFESMQLGVAPVIISDNWLPPSFIDWESCAVIVRENQAKNLKKILEPLKDRSAEMGANARTIFKEYFTSDQLGKSLNLALDNLAKTVKGNWNPTPSYFNKTTRKRKLRFKIEYYKALCHNALNRLR